jgi:hypothetical protein
LKDCDFMLMFIIVEGSPRLSVSGTFNPKEISEFLVQSTSGKHKANLIHYSVKRENKVLKSTADTNKEEIEKYAVIILKGNWF